MNLIKTISFFLVCLFPTLLQAQQTYKDYKIYRILIAVDSMKDLASGHERYKQGDIIDARPERPYTEGLGSGEVDNFIAIRVQGFSRDILDSLSVSNERNDMIYQKRRFQVRFEDLLKQWPSFDTTQIHVLGNKDNCDCAGNEFILKNGLFEAEGLIWDKEYMRYWR